MHNLRPSTYIFIQFEVYLEKKERRSSPVSFLFTWETGPGKQRTNFHKPAPCLGFRQAHYN